MSDAVIHLKPSARDLRDIPLDSDTALRACLLLKPREIGVWFKLRTHLWNYGELPPPGRELARIGGLGPKSFEKMMPILAPLFDRDRYGRWRDLDLEDERDARLDLTPERRDAIERREPSRDTPVEPRRIDPELSEKRSRGGTIGANKRWEARRQKLLLIEGGRADEPGAATATPPIANPAEVAADPMANSMANGMANETDLPPGFAAGLPSFAMSQASPGQSQLASLLESDSKKDGKTTSKLADQPAASADEPMANLVEPPMTKPAEANAAAVAKPPPTDAVIVDAVIRSCRGLVTAAHVHKRLPAIRAVMAEGVDFFLDLVPEMQAFARGKTEISNCANRPILDEARAHSRSRAAVQAQTPPAAVPQVFVVKDSPEWNAWLEHKGKKSFPVTQEEVGGKLQPGWRFEQAWPPGFAPPGKSAG